jgi:hypothetical protein
MVGSGRRSVFFGSSSDWRRARRDLRILNSFYGPRQILAEVVIEE